MTPGFAAQGRVSGYEATEMTHGILTTYIQVSGREREMRVAQKVPSQRKREREPKGKKHGMEDGK